MADDDIDPGDLTYTRVFEAPRELVFRAMITPEHLTHFWGPSGVTTPLSTISVDARPGGVFETVMINDTDGGRYPTRAVYIEVVEPERLVWREPDTGVVTTSTFTDLGDGRTQLRIRQTNVPAAFRGPEARSGFVTSLDRLTEHLARQTSKKGTS